MAFATGSIPWNKGLLGYQKTTQHYRWKGGRPKCLVCSKQLVKYGATHCRSHISKKLPSPSCLTCGRRLWKRKNKYCTEHVIRTGHVAWNKGLKGFQAGPKNNMWKGGVTPLHRALRASTEYKQWRIAVYARDNYTCQHCHQRGGRLNADHIQPFALFPELRLSVDNGRTLCFDCHKKTDTWGVNVRWLNKSKHQESYETSTQ